MEVKPQLNHPWLVAIWPGMGHVALNAGVYLLSKLQMELYAELETDDLFDVDHIIVDEGIVRPSQKPRNRFFLWKDPKSQHDLVVFLGEAQPPLGKYAFCRQLIAFAREFGVERVFTFAAMATSMSAQHRARIFCAATDQATLDELRTHSAEVLKDGHIGGLNGILLGAAAASGLQGACLLGEMPHILAQVPYPKASLAILEVFKKLAAIDLDTTELADQVREVDEQLGKVLAEMNGAFQANESEDEPEFDLGSPEEETPKAADQERIEILFARATTDRAKAFELKQELDRLGVFKEYEDRFLDLFKKSE